MLTYNELIELRKKLANGEIALEYAEELFWKDYKEDKRFSLVIAIIWPIGLTSFLIYGLLNRVNVFKYGLKFR